MSKGIIFSVLLIRATNACAEDNTNKPQYILHGQFTAGGGISTAIDPEGRTFILEGALTPFVNTDFVVFASKQAEPITPYWRKRTIYISFTNLSEFTGKINKITDKQAKPIILFRF